MRIFFPFLLLISALIEVNPAIAQSRTYYKDLSDRAHVPLYDCSIYSGPRNRNVCLDLKMGDNFRFENEGYAVSCFDLARSRRDQCLRLAEELSYNAGGAIDCSSLYRDREAQIECDITKLAYFEGRFHDRGSDRYDSRSTSTTTTIIRNEPVYSTTTTCDFSNYDRAVERWRFHKEEQRKKGQTRAAVGVVATIGGILLGGSNNRTTRTIGQGLIIGGVVMTTWGLIEIADADISYPHLDPYCRTSWHQESRMVVIEEQQCQTTRYYENTRHSTRSYYEVNCSNKRYVTFEEFEPWHDGRRISNFNY